MYAPSGDVNTICLMTSKENLFACEIFFPKDFFPSVCLLDMSVCYIARRPRYLGRLCVQR